MWVRVTVLTLLSLLMLLAVLNIVLASVAEGEWNDSYIDDNVTAWTIASNALLFIWCLIAFIVLPLEVIFSYRWLIWFVVLSALFILSILSWSVGMWILTINMNLRDNFNGVPKAALAFTLLTMILMWPVIALLVRKIVRRLIKTAGPGRMGDGKVNPVIVGTGAPAAAGTGTGTGTGAGLAYVVPTSNVGVRPQA